MGPTKKRPRPTGVNYSGPRSGNFEMSQQTSPFAYFFGLIATATQNLFNCMSAVPSNILRVSPLSAVSTMLLLLLVLELGPRFSSNCAGDGPGPSGEDVVNLTGHPHLTQTSPPRTWFHSHANPQEKTTTDADADEENAPTQVQRKGTATQPTPPSSETETSEEDAPTRPLQKPNYGSKHRQDDNHDHTEELARSNDDNDSDGCDDDDALGYSELHHQEVYNFLEYTILPPLSSVPLKQLKTWKANQKRRYEIVKGELYYKRNKTSHKSKSITHAIRTKLHPRRMVPRIGDEKRVCVVLCCSVLIYVYVYIPALTYRLCGAGRLYALTIWLTMTGMNVRRIAWARSI